MMLFAYNCDCHTESKLSVEHYEMLDTAALDYEIPQRSLRRACGGILELEPCAKTTEIVYEPVADDATYCTPCVPNKVRVCMHVISGDVL